MSNNQQISKETSSVKGKLDIITFIYGFGAAIVLVGAMFKFLGWTFANELFILGLSIEAIVFLISAFERKEEEIEYRWEHVFPQLGGGSVEAVTVEATQYRNAMQDFASTLKTMTTSMEDLSKSISDIKTYMAVSAQSTSDMSTHMSDFSQLMEHYNNNIKEINKRYDKTLGSNSKG